jgi:chromate reductase, NAD(P)H dehydrogenase (quinone)
VDDGRGANSGLAPWRGKVAGLLAASPGAFGGVRHLPHLRQVLAGLGVTVVGAQVALPKAHEAFAADGSLADERVAKQVHGLVGSVATLASKLRA